MTDDLADAMRRATSAVRAGRPLEATAIIGDALAPATATPAGEEHPARRPFPLGVVTRVLGTLRAPLEPTPPPSVPPTPTPTPTPPAARFLWRTHAAAAGSRDFRLYVPASAARGANGLVVMLHGCTQDPDDFAAGTGMNRVAEQHALVVAWPGQTKRANLAACWNWFEPAHQRRGDGEPAIIAGITEALQAEFAVAPARTFVAGLSAGGAMAAVMAATYPDLYAAAGIHSGLPYRAASDVMSAYAAMREGAKGSAAQGPRLIVFHGSADTTVAPANAQNILQALEDALPGASRSTRRVDAAGTRTHVVQRVEHAGTAVAELWIVEGMGHAWSGGAGGGSYTDPAGPDASAELARFFLAGRR